MSEGAPQPRVADRNTKSAPKSYMPLAAPYTQSKGTDALVTLPDDLSSAELRQIIPMADQGFAPLPLDAVACPGDGTAKAPHRPVRAELQALSDGPFAARAFPTIDDRWTSANAARPIFLGRSPAQQGQAARQLVGLEAGYGVLMG